jgi:hypothetical protein
MSNRVEYSLLLALVVALLSVYVLYDPSESIKQRPSTTAADGNSPGDHPGQTSPPGQANSISPSGPPDTQVAVNEKARGLNEVGLMYLNGRGVVRNLEAAFEFFSLAAQNGDVFAMANLARMYEKGWGTEANQGEALELYAKAAQLGNTLARDDWQRLRGAVSETSDASLARSRITTHSTTGRTGGSKSSSSENHKAIAVTAPDTVQPAAKVVEANSGLISLETRWSTAAIPFASSDPAQVSELTRRRTKAIELQRKSAPRELPVAQAIRKLPRHKATSRSPDRTNALADGIGQKNKVSEPPRRTNLAARSNSALPIIVDSTDTSSSAALCDWKLVRCKSLQSPGLVPPESKRDRSGKVGVAVEHQSGRSTRRFGDAVLYRRF